MHILGISAFYHDSAAALISDGRIVAAAQEERFTRIKHDHAFPVNAIRYCLEEAGLREDELDYVVYLRVPDFAAVRRWRLQQERLRPEHQRLDAEAVDDFVQYFERITLSMLDGEMRRSDPIVELADDHGVASMTFCLD